MFQWSFRVFICTFHSDISSFFGNSFLFLFLFFCYPSVLPLFTLSLILPVVLYAWETLYLTLREECRLRVFENRILRRIFRPKMVENAEWRSLHNEELDCLYRSPDIFGVIKSRRWTGHPTRMKEDSSNLKFLFSKPTG
jgi:hypothetical protein